MWAKVVTLLCVLHSMEAVFMITLPSVEVEKKIEELGKRKPYLMLSPNDASSTPKNLTNIEGELHRQPTEAKNLVDLAESLNLTTLVKALEQTGLDDIIDHEGITSISLHWNFQFY
jgi:hypothetical protein